MKRLFYIVLLFFSIGTNAQQTYSISGKVTDEKGESLPGATVFLANSKLMTTVNASGSFTLTGLQPGTYDLVVKMLGYNPYNQSVTIQKEPVNINIKLSENNTLLNEVVIKGKTDPDRARYLKLFIKNFIGESANSAACKILNPEVIQFRYDKAKEILYARSDEFIQIENSALGYKINYLLTRFELNKEGDTFLYEGKPYFEELKGSDEQRTLWDNNRKIAYSGSIRHFFKSLFNNTAEAEGFLVYRLPVKTVNDQAGNNNLPPGLYLRHRTGGGSRLVIDDLSSPDPVNSTSLFSVINDDFKELTLNTVNGNNNDSTKIFVVYTREEESSKFFNSSSHFDIGVHPSPKKSQVSFFSMINGDIAFDNKGSLLPANNIIFNGYWTWERVADLMPFDYSTGSPKPVTGKLVQIAASLDSFRKISPIEKVHIQFDKPYYSLGDTLWMKAYVVNANNELSATSRVLYVDLINDQDSVKTTMRLPLTHGLAWSALTLSDSLLKAGNYRIRAYSSVMRNLGEEYYFSKAIKIGNALRYNSTIVIPAKTKAIATGKKTQAITVKDNPDNISVQFFPEGGDLVTGLSSKIALKATGPDGLSRAISGYVVDKNNRQVIMFQSEHTGMGAFMLQPDMDNTYTAVIKLADGNEKRIQLPKAQDQGYTMQVSQNDQDIIVNIQASNSLLNSGEIALIAQANNTILYTGTKELARTYFTAVIPKNRFPEGIVQLTLFNPAYKPVAERLVFIRNNNKHLNIKLIPNKKEYAQRGRVDLNMEVTDQDNKPVIGSFSLAVTDESKIPYAEINERTIFSDLLLSTDLKGYIEQPNYYFTDANADKDRQLDNLLLTQGWRRFLWADILNNNFPQISHQIEKARNISGQVLTDKGKPEPGAKISLLVNYGNGVILDTTADNNGRFTFDFPFATETTYNVSITNAKKNTTLKVVFDKQKFAQPVTLKNLPFELPDNNDFDTFLGYSRKRYDELKKYDIHNGGILLKEVKIDAYQKTEEIKAIATQHSSNFAGPGNADVVLTFVDLANVSTGQFGLWLDGRLPGIRIKILDPINKSSWVPYSNMNGSADYVHSVSAMTLVVDGVEQDSAAYSYLDPHEIASIEILRGSGAASLYGMHGASGVFMVTTKQGDVDYNQYIDEHLHPGSTKPKGLKKEVFKDDYAMRRQFYSPNYDNPATQTQMADLRTTVYWNPTIVTDEHGKATVDFFNADGKGNYRVTVEGLNKDGDLGRHVNTYSVK
jgi:TonB-dependent SusC/RagA subfamily outer membrane receptor